MFRLSWLREKPHRLTLLALVAVGLVYVSVLGEPGWNQTSHLALVRSLYRGTPRIDRERWLTGDTAYVRGHYYAAKAPGLAFASMPAYSLYRVTGLEQTIVHDESRWQGVRIVLWTLGLFAVVLPALLLLGLVRAAAERLEPGLGTVTAVALGLGSLLLPFSSMFFAHVLSALLGFAAFVLLLRERERARDRRLVALAGLLAGLAVTVEFSLVLVGCVLGVYVLGFGGDRVRRGLTYAAGAVIGVAPLAIYNQWAFGSFTHLSYANTVLVPGRTGHDVLGANSQGFFGIHAPSLRNAIDLLFASRGLVTMSPLFAMGVVGTVLLFRRGRRAEALVIAGVALAFLLFNSGYYLPFGGWVPGPRFLIPVLPFLGFPLAIAFRRYPATTVAFAVASAVMFAVATITLPLLSSGDTSVWAHRVRASQFQETIMRFVGVDQGWAALAPFLVGLAAALVLVTAAAGTRGWRPRELAQAVGLVAVWVVAASVIAREQGDASPSSAVLITCAGALALLGLAAAMVAARLWLQVAKSGPAVVDDPAQTVV